jgi:cyclophilin family peptidyl-prolyl cis-trans isomerase
MNKKKFMAIGYTVVALLLVSAAVIAVLALTGVIGKNSEGNLSGFWDTIITPEEKYPLFKWQNSETEGDVSAVFETEAGSFSVKLSKGKAAEKFIELCESGVFNGKEFNVAAEDMFVQTSAGENSFPLEDEGYGFFYGSVCFVLDGENAADSLFIVTAKKLSGTAKGWLSQNAPDSEYSAYYEKNGGMPQYQGSAVAFAQVISGFDTLEKLADAENGGYTKGYAMLSPVKITSVSIVRPAE